MKILKIDIKDFKKEFTKEHDRMKSFLEYSKINLENQGKKCENYNNRLVEITDAATVNGLINCLTHKGLEVMDNTTGNQKTMLGYYFKMITSHIRIFEDFEFYNIALITRYLLESITGILLNYENLDSHFDEKNDKEFNNSFKDWNSGITRKIKETLGDDYSKIYKKLSRYIHPINGPLFGVEPKVVSKRNFSTIESAIKIYIKATKEIFRICNYELQIDFENYILDVLNKAMKYSMED